ncbi:MAG: serine hydrolase [Planctomycetota bacterium]
MAPLTLAHVVPIVMALLLTACRAVDGAGGAQSAQLEGWREGPVPPAVAAALAGFTDGEVTVAFRSRATGVWYAHRGDDVLHAASTMKVPVLVALHRAAHRGELDLTDRMTVRNEFASIVDGSPYALSPEDDSDPELYGLVGAQLELAELARRMIVRSSNLATNLLVARLGAGEIQRTIEGLGTRRMSVLRGVEDNKAYAAGLSNTATANDLAVLLEAIVSGAAVSPEQSTEMLAVLEGQEFNELIPAGLPPGTRVAHKTGSITRILHDAAIVLPDGEPPYVLVVLTRGFDDPARAGAAIRAVAAAAHGARRMSSSHSRSVSSSSGSGMPNSASSTSTGG